MMEVIVMSDKDIVEILHVMIKERDKTWQGAQLYEAVHSSMFDFITSLRFLSEINAINVDATESNDGKYLAISLNAKSDVVQAYAQYHKAVYDALLKGNMIDKDGKIPDLEEYIRKYNDIDTDTPTGKKIHEKLEELDQNGQLDTFIDFVNHFK